MSRSPYFPGTPSHQPVFIKLEPGVESGFLGPPSPPLAYSSNEYPDYDTVSSFACSAAGDPTVLTPVSSAGTPAMGQKALRSTYSDSPEPTEQQPTPPGSSRLFYPSYETGVSSQSSSPISIHPPVTSEGHFDMAYMATSPKEEVPPPVRHQPYFGHYGVSEAAENEGMPTMSEYPPFTTSGIDNDYLMRQVTSAAMIPCIASSHSPLSEPLHPHYRTLRTPVMEDNSALLPLPQQSLNPPFPSQLIMMDNRNNKSNSKRARRASSKKRGVGRRPSRSTVIKTEPASNSPAIKSHIPVPVLTLSEQASVEDRFLFDLKIKYSDEKGKGMWDNIRHDFKERFGGEPQRATLQMRMSRVVPKHGIWPVEERELLKAAWQKHKDESYARILADMKEMAGRPLCWDWKPMNIETELVKMGLEEPTMDLETKSRKPTRAGQRVMAAQAAQQQEYANQQGYGAPQNHLTVNWPSFGTPNQHFPLSHQPSLLVRRASYGGMDSSSGMDMAPTYTSDQEDHFLAQIEQKHRGRADGDEECMDSPMSDHMDIAYSQEAAPAQSQSNINDERSQQIAREAREQLMARQNVERLQSYIRQP